MKDKVLFIFKLPPPVNGATIMNKIIFDSTIIQSTFDSRFINYGLTKKNDQFGKLNHRKTYTYIQSLLKVLYLLFIWRPKNVYITIAPKKIAFFKDSLFVLITKCLCKNVYVHMHGKGVKQWTSKNPGISKYYRSVLKNTHVICLSKTLTTDVDSIYGARPLILPNGINNPNNDTRKDYSGLRLLFLSNFYLEKGILEFIESCRILKEQGIEFTAQAIGNSTNNCTIERINKIVSDYSLDENILHIGPKYGKDKVEALTWGNVFVFPSYYPNEAMPLVILEALSFGLYILTTAEGAISDLISKRNGAFIQPKCPNSIASKIAELGNNITALKEIGETNIEYFKQNFTKEKFESRLIEFLSSR